MAPLSGSPAPALLDEIVMMALQFELIEDSTRKITAGVALQKSLAFETPPSFIPNKPQSPAIQQIW
jgi:hypothetical protein